MTICDICANSITRDIRIEVIDKHTKSVHITNIHLCDECLHNLKVKMESMVRYDLSEMRRLQKAS